MQFDVNTLIHFLLVIVVGGIALLAVTYLAEIIIPIIFLGILVVIGILVYNYFKTGKIGF